MIKVSNKQYEAVNAMVTVLLTHVPMNKVVDVADKLYVVHEVNEVFSIQPTDDKLILGTNQGIITISLDTFDITS